MKVNQFPYGTVYKVQREHSMEDIAVTLRQIKELGMNFVVIWPAVFWWEDKTLSGYPYHTGQEILKLAQTIGLRVVMETAGQVPSLEYAPDFRMKPEYFATGENGQPVHHSQSFDYINYNHPDVKRMMKNYLTEIAQAYKDYPALHGYDIWNETMFASYDAHTIHLFREWLQNKYGTIAELNRVWDRAYQDWSEVQITRWLWASVMPFVDLQQFRKQTIGMLLKEWRDIIRETDSSHPVIADNIGSMLARDEFYYRPHDDWTTAANVDEYGISFYSKENMQGTRPSLRWQNFVGIHSAAPTGRYWISEMQSHNRNMFNPTSVVYPHEIKQWNWEAIAHGAKGIIYWKWHPFIKGVQTAGRGLVNAKGEYTQRALAAERIAGILHAHDKAFTEYEPELPSAAILYDTLSLDFSKSYTQTMPSEQRIYHESLAGLYEGLWECSIPVKFIKPEDVISQQVERFPVLFVTNQINIGPSLAAALRHYVEQGGTLICDGKFGEIGDDGILNRHLPGGELGELLGFEQVDIDPLDLDIHYSLEDAEAVMPGFFEKKCLHVSKDGSDRVETIGFYGDGSPAMIRSTAGTGQVLFISTFLWYGYWKKRDPRLLDFIRRLDKQLNLSLHRTNNDNLKYCTMQGDDGKLLFVFNYGSESEMGDIEVSGVPWNRCSILELYTEQLRESDTQEGQLTVHVEIEPQDVCIYKISKS